MGTEEAAFTGYRKTAAAGADSLVVATSLRGTAPRSGGGKKRLTDSLLIQTEAQEAPSEWTSDDDTDSVYSGDEPNLWCFTAQDIFDE